jgi:hypothetical protein
MSASPALTFPSSPEVQANEGKVRPQEQTFPPSGSASADEIKPTHSASQSEGRLPQDEVKLQWNSAQQVPVYQFVTQQGTLILQVPSEQLLDLARDIAQEFDREPAFGTKDTVEGGKENGH